MVEESGMIVAEPPYSRSGEKNVTDFGFCIYICLLAIDFLCENAAASGGGRGKGEKNVEARSCGRRCWLPFNRRKPRC